MVNIAAPLLNWYDSFYRVLPWRSCPGSYSDPYHVWLSEVMLQQTTVPTVGPYFQAFISRWPTIQELAAASLDDVLHGWQGLGYYARGRNLHKCAQTIVNEFKGEFPRSREELLKLPGIGPYTAAAIAAIAFNQSEAVVDGNIERILCRLYNLKRPLPEIKKEIWALAAPLTPKERPGDYAQGLMDLGAMVCTPQNPKCEMCPISGACKAFEQGTQASLPVKAEKSLKPTRYAYAFFGLNARGEVLLQKRPPKGLLGGMMEIPTTPWSEKQASSLEISNSYAPFEANWIELKGQVKHTFTHFHFIVRVCIGRTLEEKEATWCPLENLSDYALPTLMKKIVHHAVSSPEASQWGHSFGDDVQLAHG